MDIVLFGIQGSGKGTLAKAVSNEYGFHYFETGGALRALSQENSELGKKVKTIVESGQLVPNNVVMEIVEDFVKKLPNNACIIFDGIPRQLIQAETFENLMKKFERDFKGILVDVPEEVAIKRLTTRRVCSQCKEVYPEAYPQDQCKKCGGTLIIRSDDNPEVIKARISTYYEETVPVIEKYKKENKIIIMDGTVSIEEAQKNIYKIVSDLQKNNLY